ncbi:hypothetical protein [Lysinibacter cavernae]|uniref:Heme/copper-type cytochrome/quinol oxidase subunit 2 n=1 Tax=Lysinibacter cavernae TaxID=1640652 RepID=A0A7X5R1I6_9MICO|nr:hypothetical protein [Lysinibacter cavernae]NIH53645.1 heme/copper-type cytochrome/quinol oxidase subunit 2 [Lysinibacter cavernae]
MSGEHPNAPLADERTRSARLLVPIRILSVAVLAGLIFVVLEVLWQVSSFCWANDGCHAFNQSRMFSGMFLTTSAAILVGLALLGFTVWALLRDRIGKQGLVVMPWLLVTVVVIVVGQAMLEKV